MRIGRFFAALSVACTLGVAVSLPAHAQTAKAALKDAGGKDVGTAVGKCEPPFTSAGGHFNPAGKKHGMEAKEGAHAGDMPNLYVPANGELTVDVANHMVTLAKGQPNSVFDADGSAIIIHAGADDYKSDPTGNAGDRIACGVITE